MHTHEGCLGRVGACAPGIFFSVSMNYQKPYLTPDQKILLLKDKGLIISDEAFASEFIQQVGFSRFLSFSETFMDKSERFVSKTDFYKIVSIYRLDAKLRAMVFGAIEPIEISFRAVWTDAFTRRYGALGYLESQNFNNVSLWSTHRQKLEKEWQKVNDASFKRYIGKYEHPPLWFVVHSMSFGSLSKWISNSSIDVQTDLLSFYKFRSISELELTLKSLSILRNYCAHHARIWDNYFPIAFPQLNKDKGGKKLYFSLRLIAELNNRIHPTKMSGSKWYEQIEAIVQNFPRYQRKAMGFPQN